MIKINKGFMCVVLLTSYVFAEPLKINGQTYDGSFTYNVGSSSFNNIYFQIKGDNIEVGSLPNEFPSEPKGLLSDKLFQKYSSFCERYAETYIGGGVSSVGSWEHHERDTRVSVAKFVLQAFGNIVMDNAFFESRSGRIHLKTQKLEATNIFMKTDEVILMAALPTAHPLKGISWKCRKPSLHPFSCFVSGHLSFKDFSTNESLFLIFGAQELVFNPISE